MKTLNMTVPYLMNKVRMFKFINKFLRGGTPANISFKNRKYSIQLKKTFYSIKHVYMYIIIIVSLDLPIIPTPHYYPIM